MNEWYTWTGGGVIASVLLSFIVWLKGKLSSGSITIEVSSASMRAATEKHKQEIEELTEKLEAHKEDNNRNSGRCIEFRERERRLEREISRLQEELNSRCERCKWREDK